MATVALKVWAHEPSKGAIPVSDSEFGVFDTTLAYVVKSESQRMLFVWSGADVLEQSLKAATAHAADLAKSMEDNMMIVQVAQGKETEEFSKLFSSLEYKGLETSDDAEENQEEAAFEPRSASAMSPAGATGSKKKRKKKKKGKSGSQPSAVAEDDNADDSKEKEEETDEQKESLAKEVSESAVVKGDNATVAQHEVSPQTNLDVKEKENSASDATQVKMAIDDGGSKVESTAKGQNDGQTPDGPKTTLSDIQDTKLEQNEESESAHQKMTETQNPTEKLIETWKPEEKEQVDVVKDTTTSMNIGDESKGALSDGTLPLVDAEQVKEDPDKEKETEAGDTTQVESFVVDVPQQGNQKPAKVDDKVSDEEKVSKDEDISNTTGMIPSKNASTDTMLSDSRLKKATATDVVIKPDQHKDNSNNPKVSSAPSQETNLAAPLNYLADSAKAWTPVLSKPEGSDVNVPVGAKIFPYEELKQLRADSGIDMTCKESYLSDEEFLKVFEKDRASWSAQPAWRRLLQKKEVGLW